MLLDLNAKRAARTQQRGGAMQILIGEETFDLVDELPIEIGEMANNNQIWDAFRIMLRNPDEDWDRLRRCRPSFNDIMDVIEYFGTTLGESVRSTGNLATTGQPSKPTSTATTDATSLATVTAINGSTPDGSPGSSAISPQSPPTSAS